MKIFQSVRRDLAFFGINANQSWMHKSPFNTKNQIAMSIFCLFLFLNGVNFTYANSFEEYINCIYIVTALAGTVLCFATLMWESAKWFEFMESVENIFNKSEYQLEFITTIKIAFIKLMKFIFKELKNPSSKIACTSANKQAEKWTGIVQFIVAKIAPQFTMLPKFIVSICLYFTTVDSSSHMDTLALPLPMWLVCDFIHF